MLQSTGSQILRHNLATEQQNSFEAAPVGANRAWTGGPEGSGHQEAAKGPHP